MSNGDWMMVWLIVIVTWMVLIGCTGSIVVALDRRHP